MLAQLLLHCRFLALCLTLLAPSYLAAEQLLELPGVFSDHMVVQREGNAPVWGRAQPGAEVTVSFAGQTVKAKADRDGRWQTTIQPGAASLFPRTLTVTDGTTTHTYGDVLVGDVWLCSGQSNMEWSVNQSKDGDLERLAANEPLIRILRVDRKASPEPQFTTSARWQVVSPETVGGFSAVGYYFGRDLQRVLDIPIGLIDSTWGGTPAIAWTRPSAMSAYEPLEKQAASWDKAIAEGPEAQAKWEKEMAAWVKRTGNVVYHPDPGIAPAFQAAFQPDFDDSTWQIARLPVDVESLHGKKDGAVWFRKKVKIPAAWQGQELTLNLGKIDDFDQVWVNGTSVGGISDPDRDPWRIARSYQVPAELTKTGELLLAVRVFDHYGGGGFTSTADELQLIGPDGRQALDGEWLQAAELLLEPALGPRGAQRAGAPRSPRKPNEPRRPGNLANGMLAPIAPYALRGAIWYQGESDAGWSPHEYDQRLRVMIEDWRVWWQQPELPFGIVQLAGFRQPGSDPKKQSWAEIRESQRRLARDLPHTGLAVAIDLGEIDDIHPVNKQEVGRRLARWALADVYGKLERRGGPEPTEVSFADGKALITFTQVGKSLRPYNGKPLKGFTLAGKDGVFHPAEAVLNGGDQVVVTSEAVPQPTQVRYAWDVHPIEANLSTIDRLPASPFQLSSEDSK